MLSTTSGLATQVIDTKNAKVSAAALPVPKPFSKIPGPRGLPFIGSLWDYIKPGGYTFEKMFEVYQLRAQKYGPIFKERLGHVTNIVISDPEQYNKVIFNEGKYPNRKPLEPLAYYRSHVRDVGLGVVNAQGEEWRNQRSIISKKMLRIQEVARFTDVMSDVATDLVTRIDKIKDPTTSEVPELEFEVFKWAMESVCTFLFDTRIGCFQEPPSMLAQEFLYNLLEFFKSMQPLMYNMPVYRYYPTQLWKKFSSHLDSVFAIGQMYVDKKITALDKISQKGKLRESMMEFLLAQEGLTKQEVNSTAIEMMTGGVETVSNATLWNLFCLAKNQKVQEQLYAEISHVVPEDVAEITPQHLAKLPLVKACVKECFRLYPITFATSRHIQKDMEIGGYHIPEGSHVQANLYYMGRDASLFPEPMEFRPERWLRDDDNRYKALSNLVWGHGPRMCIGRRIAEQEIHIILAKIIQKFQLKYHHAEDVEPVLHTIMTGDRPFRIAFNRRK
ncbi:cytochrome P450 10-like [Tubulanus polymorphus]|uniref:cytochrome P450 10-like n=1 Tax=Tubulanus polymorphus TaxID=672921 RepID=UPI003DA320D8